MTIDSSRLKIERGVLDLLFAQLKSGHWWLLPLVFLILFLVRESIHPNILAAWLLTLILYLLISDHFIFHAYGKRWLELEDNNKWSALLIVHNLLLGSLMGVLPPLCLLQPDQFTIIIVGVVTCNLVIGGAAILASHVYSYIAWSLPQIAGLIIFINHQQISELLSLSYFAVATFVIGIVFAIKTRQLVYSSVKTNIRNEELVNQLLDKQDIARRAAEDKSRFLASASHDLRQPLHALGLFVESLNRILEGERERKILKSIEQSTDALQHLFNALLDISRLDAGVVEVDKRHFELKKILEKIDLEYQPLAKEKGISLFVEKSNHIIYADKILSERILRNLISNAIKYTSEGSVRLEVSSQHDQVKVSIIDTGIGIPDTDMDTIFNEFYQIHNPQRDRSKGLGLGLSIVRRLVDLMSLELNVTSSKSNGTTFSVSFPTGDVTQISNIPIVNTGGWDRFKNLRTLVIDDDTQVRESMNTMLNDWGARVTLADSFETAISLVKNDYRPDLILSDLRLSDELTGIDAIQQIREITCTEIPALLISGDTAPERIMDAKVAGITLLHKPVKAAKLRVALNQMLLEYNEEGYEE